MNGGPLSDGVPSITSTNLSIRSKLPENNALELARAGHESGFRWLFERYREPIARLLDGQRLDCDTRDDVLQETFIRAFGGLEQLHDNGAWESWLVRIAQRLAFQATRRQKRYVRLDAQLVCDEHDFAAAVEKERLAMLVRTAFSAVRKDAIARTGELYYFAQERRTTDAIAAELQIPPATVRKRLHLFRQRLRRWLHEAYAAGLAAREPECRYRTEFTPSGRHYRRLPKSGR
jgi:RNA polymerase sigma-70 factor (ECF subfamily)